MSECKVCGSDQNLKRGWTNSWYCSEDHERSDVSDLHAGMPGAGPVPDRNWVPLHIGVEISNRWRGQ